MHQIVHIDCLMTLWEKYLNVEKLKFSQFFLDKNVISHADHPLYLSKCPELVFNAKNDFFPQILHS